MSGAAALHPPGEVRRISKDTASMLTGARFPMRTLIEHLSVSHLEADQEDDDDDNDNVEVSAL